MPEISLLPYKSQNFSFVSNLLANEVLMHGWGVRPYSVAEAKEFVSDKIRKILLIKDTKTNKIVGFVNFYDINKIKKESDWGVVISPEFQGKGYAQISAKESITFGFNELNLKRIEIYIESYNATSIHLHEKIGFKFIKKNEKNQLIYEKTKIKVK